MCFVFKQKTAYELRISDWSSDVCSSDLRGDPVQPARDHDAGAGEPHPARGTRAAHALRHRHEHRPHPRGSRPAVRSEEHTSELQSLMRISYAVFCLKKTNLFVTYTTDT